jgi:hypothetical protein
VEMVTHQLLPANCLQAGLAQPGSESPARNWGTTKNHFKFPVANLRIFIDYLERGVSQVS